ncbi:MAG: type II toxin-antitoxin system Phd/YefM family antitoxin [Synergistaceae bacterium]|nr:type II toxin-antitoxin system Phd/YefM family antitoxin [Synergistaceae bacterium]
MENITAVNFSKNVFNVLDRAIINHESFNVSTDKGNAVILSDEDYRGMKETLYLLSVPGMKEKLLAGMAEPLSECVSEEDAGW